jgi:hypothetical protein
MLRLHASSISRTLWGLRLLPAEAAVLLTISKQDCYWSVVSNVTVAPRTVQVSETVVGWGPITLLEIFEQSAIFLVDTQSEIFVQVPKVAGR